MTTARPVSFAPVLTRALRDGIVFAAIVAIVGGLIGFLVAGVPGLLGGLLGAATSCLFLGLTAVSMLIGARVTHGDTTSPMFFGIVLGTWLLKLILFLVFAVWLRTQDWLDPRVVFVTVIVSVIGSLVLDGLAIARTRVPYVDVELPGDRNPSDSGSDDPV